MTIQLDALSAETAARQLYDHVCELARADGQDPSIEVGFFSPDQDPCGCGQWRVTWDAGPFQWGVAFTLGGRIDEEAHGFRYDQRPEAIEMPAPQHRRWVAEPFYGCDVGFSQED